MPLIVLDLICSRCHKAIEGYDLNGATAGYVDVRAGRFRKYGRPGETHVCDECLLADPEYQRDNPAAQGMLGV